MNQTSAKKSGNPNWVKGGASPNPAGRPAVLRDLREAARGFSAEALETLATVMRDPDAPHASRVAAAKELLDRGFGKAVQSVDVDVKLDVSAIQAAELMRLSAAAKEIKVIDVTPGKTGTAAGEVC